MWTICCINSIARLSKEQWFKHYAVTGHAVFRPHTTCELPATQYNSERVCTRVQLNHNCNTACTYLNDNWNFKCNTTSSQCRCIFLNLYRYCNLYSARSVRDMIDRLLLPAVYVCMYALCSLHMHILNPYVVLHFNSLTVIFVPCASCCCCGCVLEMIHTLGYFCFHSFNGAAHSCVPFILLVNAFRKL